MRYTALSTQLGDHSVPAPMINPEHGFFTGTTATTSLVFGSILKTTSVGLLLTQTMSSPIASQSGEPPVIAYCASGTMLDMGCWTPGTPGFSCANKGTMASVLTRRTNKTRFMTSFQSRYSPPQRGGVWRLAIFSDVVSNGVRIGVSNFFALRCASGHA